MGGDMDSLTEAAYHYLGDMHSTLWGETWNIYDDRERAAVWLASQVRAAYGDLLKELEDLRDEVAVWHSKARAGCLTCSDHQRTVNGGYPYVRIERTLRNSETSSDLRL